MDYVRKKGLAIKRSGEGGAKREELVASLSFATGASK